MRVAVAAENVAHAVGFELEDGGRFAAGEEFVGFGSSKASCRYQFSRCGSTGSCERYREAR